MGLFFTSNGFKNNFMFLITLLIKKTMVKLKNAKDEIICMM